MRRALATMLAVLAIAMISGCSAGDEDADDDAATADGGAVAEGESDAAASDDGGAVQAAQVDPSPREIIHYVDLTVAVDDVEADAQRAAVLAETSGGYVADESSDGTESATLTLRVPADGHTEIVEQLEEFGEVRSRSRTAQDVTDEVVDVDARITSQRRSIDRIRVLLDQAVDIDDIVRIESELASREAELDSLLQRQEELSGLTSLATVTVTFVATGSGADDALDAGFLGGLGTGWNAFVDVVRVMATLLGVLLPFLATAAVIGLPLWWGMRRRRQPAAPAPTGADQI
ncbi:MAG: DUF4349 domain-containing protein [Jiangellaceae bacterium]